MILATGERVVMEDSIQLAVDALTGFTSLATDPPTDGGAPIADPTVAAPDPVQAGFDSLDSALKDLEAGLTGLQAALEQLRGLVGGDQSGN